ncbi:MAG TPA: cupredoxin domain-containing protein [Panacibacter sp.]|nr:cupredoxin domain-containing protein [Panacibacter sp.]
MKKILLLAFITVMSSAAFATVFIIKVQNYQFKPSVVNAKVGDSIYFKWVNGGHTTTSTSVPSGAMAWNKPMDSAHKKFLMRVLVAGVYQYHCIPHSPEMAGTINVTTVSPAGFEGLSIRDLNNKAQLTWNTKSATDVSFFSVQKSTDGKNFTEIAQVKPSAGNKYSYTDNQVATVKYVYYQVKVIDTKNSGELSEIKMYEAKNVNQKLITSISPNPVSSPGHLSLQFNADIDGVMLVQLYNSNGTLIKQAPMTASKGLNNGHFHLGDLKTGTYYITCTLGNITEKHTIVYR